MYNKMKDKVTINIVDMYLLWCKNLEKWPQFYWLKYLQLYVFLPVYVLYVDLVYL